jgi:predicted 2-oxoglutarate/Fe(II)-dependent dioxygenase YbiX
MNINDYILKGNYIDKNACNFIIKKIQKENWQTHQYYCSEKKEYYNHKEKELQVLTIDNSINDLIKEVVFKAMNDYEKYYDCIDFCTNISNIRFNRYQQNNEMKNHVDHIRDIFDGQKNGIPILSIVGILNDDYQGGDFVFNDNYKVKLNVGDILMFPSNFMYKHRVTTVLKNIRYSFVCWGY